MSIQPERHDMSDNRKYMTWEQRAIDDPRYRPGGKYGAKVAAESKTVTCYCGKTVIVDGFGTKTGQVCPRDCEPPARRTSVARRRAISERSVRKYGR